MDQFALTNSRKLIHWVQLLCSRPDRQLGIIVLVQGDDVAKAFDISIRSHGIGKTDAGSVHLKCLLIENSCQPPFTHCLFNLLLDYSNVRQIR